MLQLAREDEDIWSCALHSRESLMRDVEIHFTGLSLRRREDGVEGPL
jgi:hypothetical protein